MYKILQMGGAIEEVTDWERRVEDSQDSFHKISEVIKVKHYIMMLFNILFSLFWLSFKFVCLRQVEMELFQHYRVADFKAIIVVYLEELSRTQQEMAGHWEAFLPEVQRAQL